MPVNKDQPKAAGEGPDSMAAWGDSAVELAKALVEPVGWDRLVDLCQTGGGQVWLINGVGGEAGFLVGGGIGRLLVDDEHFGVDVHLARPEGDRWKLEEIDTQIIKPGLVAPVGSLRVVVVGYAEQLGLVGADHLLKTLEEVPSGTRYVLMAADADQLPRTILGRVAQKRTIALAAAELRMATLVASGEDHDAIREVFSLCGSQVGLAAAVIGDVNALEDLRSVLGGKINLERPVNCAIACAEALDRLVKRMPGADSSARREILRVMLVGLEERVVRQLRKANTPLSFRRRLAELDAIESARRAVDVYVSPLDVLTVLFSRLANAGWSGAASRDVGGELVGACPWAAWSVH